MRCDAKLMMAIAGIVSLGACAPVDPGFGEALRYDMAIQTVDPDPVYPEDGAKPGDSGEKGAKASERYRKGQTKPVQREETELVIIVTPRLVRPVRAAAMKLPTDRVTAPDEADLFLLGRTDSGVGVNPLAPTQASPVARPIGEMPNQPRQVLPPSGGMAALDPTKLEKDYGHAL